VENLGVELTDDGPTDAEVEAAAGTQEGKLAAAYDEKTAAEMKRDEIRSEVERLRSGIANGTS
jgi:hypothetical protein